MLALAHNRKGKEISNLFGCHATHSVIQRSGDIFADPIPQTPVHCNKAIIEWTGAQQCLGGTFSEVSGVDWVRKRMCT